MAQGKEWDKEKVIELLKPYLMCGMSVTKACSKIGIPQSTVGTWIASDEVLSLKVTSWQNHTALNAMQMVTAAIENGDIQTAKWFLERKEKDDFSLRTEMSGSVNIGSVLPEDLKKRADELINESRESPNTGIDSEAGS